MADEQAIDTSVPFQPAGWGAYQTTREAPPPPRDIVDYVRDSALNFLRSGVGIAGGVAGALTAIPAPPEGEAWARRNQDVFNDIGWFLTKGMSPGGQAQMREGGPDIFKEPVDALAQGVITMAPWVPLLAAGPLAGIGGMAATSVGDVRNRLS